MAILVNVAERARHTEVKKLLKQPPAPLRYANPIPLYRRMKYQYANPYLSCRRRTKPEGV